MSINAINNQEMIIQPTSLDTNNTNELGQEEFLNILITQLKYQDPLEPLDDTEFISQLAEFSSLEQMQMINEGVDYSNIFMQMMNQNITYSNAFSIMGKEVEANIIDEATGEETTVTGIVESVSVEEGKVVLSVNGKDIGIESVVKVIEPDSIGDSDSIDDSDLIDDLDPVDNSDSADDSDLTEISKLIEAI